MAKSMAKSADRVLWMDQGKMDPGKKVRSNPRKSGFLLFIPPMILLILSSLFYVWSRIQVIQLGYEISNALKENRGGVETNKKLRIDIAALKSYGRIERIATEELKMFKPRPDQVIVIR